MKLNLEISKEAWFTLNELAEFVESKNTLGAGNRNTISLLYKIYFVHMLLQTTINEYFCLK